MNTNQINHILSTDPHTKPFFLGTFPCDQLPESLPHTFSLVVNTDNSSQPGSHWQSIFGRGDSVYFFDSFGRAPSGLILQFCQQFPHIFFNAASQQLLTTSTCAAYAIYHIHKQSRGVPFRDIVDTFVRLEHDCEYLRDWMFQNYHFVLV